MMLKNRVVRSQLVPARQRRAVPHRRRLESRLLSVPDYPLTLVHGGTGYGQTAALDAPAAGVKHPAWSAITKPDRVPLLFLAHLIYASDRDLPSGCEAALRLVDLIRPRLLLVLSGQRPGAADAVTTICRVVSASLGLVHQTRSVSARPIGNG